MKIERDPLKEEEEEEEEEKEEVVVVVEVVFTRENRGGSARRRMGGLAQANRQLGPGLTDFTFFFTFFFFILSCSVCQFVLFSVFHLLVGLLACAEDGDELLDIIHEKVLMEGPVLFEIICELQHLVVCGFSFRVLRSGVGNGIGVGICICILYLYLYLCLCLYW